MMGVVKLERDGNALGTGGFRGGRESSIGRLTWKGNHLLNFPRAGETFILLLRERSAYGDNSPATIWRLGRK